MYAKRIGIIIWAVVAVAFIFCFWFFGIRNLVSDSEEDLEGEYIVGSIAECSHGDDFVEPVLTNGDYYIDGNSENDRFYVHIDDETYNVCGDVEGYLDTFITFFDEDYKAEEIKLYSNPIRYEINTNHDVGDKTIIRLEQKTENGLQFSSGPQLLSETSFKVGDNVFKLVESVDDSDDSQN